MKQCKNCKHFRPCEDNPRRGVCTNPDRDDGNLVYYFGSLKDTDYCALHDSKRKELRHD